MPRFPHAEQLSLPCRFEEYRPGRLHPDGHRYLPLLILRPLHQPAPALAIVDRHHRVDPQAVGRSGVARLVWLLSIIQLQKPPYRQGLEAEADLPVGRASPAPLAFGQVVSVPTWEVEDQHLPYQALHTELVLDIGIGTIGVRTNATADDLSAEIGKPRLEPGDWLQVSRSRIDILEFQ